MSVQGQRGHCAQVGALHGKKKDYKQQSISGGPEESMP